MKPMPCLLALLLLAGSAAPALAAAEFDEGDPLVLDSEGFLNGHQDMLSRNRGVFEYQRQRYADAARYFRHAAFYGDKPSQAMLAMMLWNGEGVAADRAQAYAWIDLAAERGYPSFIATREKFWAALGEDERRHALDVGKTIYATYGDERAHERLRFEMSRAKRQLTGSHLGRPGTIAVNVQGPDGRRFRRVDGALFYNERYWNPESYLHWQDRHWDLPRGHVEVGPVQPTADDPGSPL